MPLVQMPDGQTVQMPDKPSKAQLTEIRSKVKSGPKRMTETAHGRRMGGKVESYADYPDLPYLDRTVVAGVDKPEEAKAYLEKKYGEGSVSKDKRGLVVTSGGKKMRVNTGLDAEVTAQAPELVLGTAGALGGAAVGGPAGAIAGAGAGGALGKGIKEAAKSAGGVQRQSPMEVTKSVGEAGVSMMEGEGAGKALGLARKLPIREKMFDITPDIQSKVARTTAGGARPPPASYAPGGRKLARITILADKLSGPNKNIDRANFGYLQDKASAILDKAGVHGNAKDETMGRLAAPGPAMSFQDTGKLIQNNAKMMLDNMKQLNKGKLPKNKDAAYLAQVSALNRTPEQAYEWLTERGETDRLERYFKVMGKNSVVVQAIQQRALRQLLSGALVRTESGEAVGALDAELNRYTIKQQRMLFPNGLEKDIKRIAEDTQFLYPKIKDPAMAGFTAGTIMQHAWYNRFYAQGMYSFGRALLQNPTLIRRIAIGLRGSKTRTATKAAIKGMFMYGALEMNNGGQDPEETNPEIKEKLQ